MRYLPNALSIARILIAPVLILLAWNRHESWFLLLLVAALASDVLDGFIARTFNLQSELGARLDSYGDMAIYLTVPVAAWLLFPHLIIQERIFVTMVVAAYILPIVAALIKFRQLTSFHTVAAKVAAVLMGVCVLFAFYTNNTWPFRLAAIVQLLVSVEYLLIIQKLSTPKSNITSWFSL